jgi:uncharacterized membrane protein YvlD (DUF360 family)
MSHRTPNEFPDQSFERTHMNAPVPSHIDRQYSYSLARSLIAVMLLLVTGSWVATDVALAQTPSGVTPAWPKFTGDIRIGFEDQYHLGRWVPIDLELQGGLRNVQGTISIRAVDGDSFPTLQPGDRALALAAGDLKTIRVYAMLGSSEQGFTATFQYTSPELSMSREASITTSMYDDRHPLPGPLAPGQPLTLVFGQSFGLSNAAIGETWDGYSYGPTNVVTSPDGSEIETLEDDTPGAAPPPKWRSGQEPVVVDGLKASQLPDRWYGYDAVSTLVLNARNPADYDALSDAQRDAILGWVARGGHVLISGGAGEPQLIAPQSFLGKLIPGRFRQPHNLIEGRGFEEFIPGEGQLPVSRDEPLTVAVLEDVAGEVIAQAGSIPLVIRGSYGLGRVTYAAVDLRDPLLGRWNDYPVFLRRLADWQEVDTNPQDNNYQYGYWAISDTTSDLMQALERFEGIRVVPFSLVALLIGVYIILIGPVDYILVHRILKRPALTWITFPIFVILVSAGCYYMAAYLKGDTVRLNEASLVDVNLTNGQVRATSWMNLYAPATQSFQLQALPGEILPIDPPAEGDLQLAWLGTPEMEGLGGMGGSGTLISFGRAYTMGPESAEMAPVPLQIASTKAFIARWTSGLSVSSDEVLGVDLETAPRRGGLDLLKARLTNRLDVPLTDCMLLWNRNLYPVGTLNLDATVEVDLRSDRQMNLFEGLLGELNVDDQTGQASIMPQAFRVDSGDAGRVLRLMSFFRAADGGNRTSLSNNYQEFVDLSGTLAAGHAVLLARVDASGTQLTDTENTLKPKLNQTTFIRFVLPRQTP